MQAAMLSTSNAGKFRDSAPFLPAAGKVLTNPDDGTHRCMKMDTSNMPSTPPAVKPFRKSALHELGRGTVHYGRAHDAPPPDRRYGHINDYSDSAQQVMVPKVTSAFEEHMDSLREASKPLYRADPLGKTANKFGVVLPEECKDPNYVFGMETNSSESTKTVIYPLNDPHDDSDPAIHSMYVKTHGHFEAGEQKKLGYNWLAHGIDPMSFRFGAVPKQAKEGVVDMLKPDDAACTRTTFVRKEVEAFRDITYDALGQARNQGFGRPPADTNTTFGRANNWDEWDAVRLLRGDYNTQDMSPDRDLGKSKSVRRAGYQPVTPPPDRTFGVPTVRSDVPKPKQKRVTDFQNYGDEISAERLMYPSSYAPILVHEEDFTRGHSKEFLWDLQQTAGIGLSADEFEKVWAQAQMMFASSDGTCSVENFRRAMSALDM